MEVAAIEEWGDKCVYDYLNNVGRRLVWVMKEINAGLSHCDYTNYNTKRDNAP